MSGRRRRSEAIWDDKEEQRASAEIHPNISPGRSGYWSKSDAHDDSMRGNFSRSPSRNHLHGNRNGPRDDDIRRDRNRMYSHPTPDGWEKQYNTRPSDESYDLPYRSRDKEVGCNARMSRERERSRSPLRSRSRERERSRSRDCVSRSSRENTRGPRHETDASYPNMRNNSRDFVSRGGDNNTTGSWNSRTDYKGGGGSRYNDHRNTRMPPCKFFAAGNCNRDYCKFSHDVPEASRGYDDNRSIANKNRAWHSDQQAHDDSYAGGFNKTSHQDHTSDDNNNNNNKWDSWDDKKMSFDGHASRDASGFHDVGKSHPNVDNKRSSWNGPTSWDDASGSGFSSVSNPCRRYEETAKESLNDNNAKSGGNIDRNKTKKWDGPLWDEFSEPVVVQTDSNNNNNNIRKWDASGSSKMASHNAEMVVNDSDLNNVVSEDANRQILTSGKDLIQSVHDITGSEQRQTLLSNPYNGPLNGHGVHMENQNTEGANPLKPLEMDVAQPQAVNDVNDTSLTSQLAPQANAIPQLYTESHLASAIDYLKSLPNSAYNQDTKAKEEQDSVIQQNRMPDVMKTEAIDKRVAENVNKKEEENMKPDNGDAHGKVEEGDTGNDEKAMRLFKAGLVEFVKEILKPKWKEGKMSRDVYKTVVKKVVEKVTSTIQGTQIPRTQPKIDQYLSYSKPKITKLVEAYMEKLLKS
ncbi:putative transcription factor C3H family [Helianthus annuus]|nr:putative transcription factor C3H family [Helianthus annuus]